MYPDKSIQQTKKEKRSGGIPRSRSAIITSRFRFAQDLGTGHQRMHFLIHKNTVQDSVLLMPRNTVWDGVV
jgi:hypothetical protein